jgi:hypothetical protein
MLGVGIAIGVGGSFGVVAGARLRTRPWMRRAGLEWLVRMNPGGAATHRAICRHQHDVLSADRSYLAARAKPRLAGRRCASDRSRVIDGAPAKAVDRGPRR